LTIEDFENCLLESMKYPKMDLLIEEFYDGHELDIDILVQDNKAVFIGISDNFKPQEPDFFETGIATPSLELTIDEKNVIENLVSEWIPKFNLQNAILHFEAFCRPSNLYPNRQYNIAKPFESLNQFFMPIELNLRLGGDHIWTINYAAYGVDLFRRYIDLMLGLRLDEQLLKFQQHNPASNSITHNFTTHAAPCNIQSISVDIDAVLKSPKIVEIGVWKTKLPNTDYFACLTISDTTGTSKSDLLDTKTKCIDLIQFQFSSENV
jgi:hypothetical protein